MNSIFILSIFSFVLSVAKCTENLAKISQGRESTIHVDLDAIEYNYQQLAKKLTPGHPIMAVVKSNAYGLGSVSVSRTLLELGAKYLAVAFVDEGIYLRNRGINAPIIALGYTAPTDQAIELALHYDITLTVYTKEVLDAIQFKAWYSQRRGRIHIKVNTGLNRLGLELDELVPFVETIKNGFYPAVVVEGVFSHLPLNNYPNITESDKEFARDQLNSFKRVVTSAREIINIPIAHMASDDFIEFFGEESFLDMVRPGCSILGYRPSTKSALSITSIISAIRKPIKAQKLENNAAEEWTATVPFGLSDGLPPDCRGEVLIKGIRVPILPGIMMDQMLVNATGAYPVKINDQVVIIGHQGEEEITSHDVAKMCGGSAYSLTARLSERIPRVYYRNGRVVFYENHLLM